MTGPEHFKEAEDLVGDVQVHGGDYTPEGRAGAIAMAQVHATLALAAATASTGMHNHPAHTWDEWRPLVVPQRAEAAEASGGEGRRTVTFDITDAAASFALTQALEDFAVRQRDQATDEHGHEVRERWADLADEMRAQAEAAG
jgi:hypothetical protein